MGFIPNREKLSRANLGWSSPRNGNMKKLLFATVLSMAATLALAPLAGAWETSQSASAVCVDGVVVMKASLTNNDERVMNVLIRFGDIVTREVVGLEPGANTGTISVETGNSQIDATTVSFELTWNDGSEELDTRFVEVPALRCETPATTTAPTTMAPATTTTATPTTTTTTTTTEVPEYGLIPPISIVREPLSTSTPELAYTGAGQDIAMIVIAFVMIGAGAAFFRVAEKRKNQ